MKIETSFEKTQTGYSNFPVGVWLVEDYPYFEYCSIDFHPKKKDLEYYKKQFEWKKWGEDC